MNYKNESLKYVTKFEKIKLHCIMTGCNKKFHFNILGKFMKKILVATALLASMTAANAYQNEYNATAGYAHLEQNGTNNNVEGATAGGSATYYLSNVDTSKGPLAEAAFTTQTSSITAGYAYAQGASEIDGKAHVFAGSGEFYIPTKLVGLDSILPVQSLYAAGGVSRAKVEGSGANGYQYTAEVGVLPVANLLLVAGVVGNGNLGKNNNPNLIVRGKYVYELMGKDVNLEGSVIFDDNRDKFYQLATDYYLDKTLSIGAIASYAGISGVSDPYGLNINARKFVTENVSFLGGVSYGRGLVSMGNTSVDNSAAVIGGTSKDDIIGVNLGATLRF